MSLRTTWSTWCGPGQLGLYSETLSLKKKKNKTSVAYSINISNISYGIEKLLTCYVSALVVLPNAAVEDCTEVMVMVMECVVCIVLVREQHWEIVC